MILGTRTTPAVLLLSLFALVRVSGRANLCFVGQQQHAFSTLTTHQVVKRRSDILKVSPSVSGEIVDRIDATTVLKRDEEKKLHPMRKKKKSKMNRKARRRRTTAEKKKKTTTKEEKHVGVVVSEEELVAHLDAMYHGEEEEGKKKKPPTQQLLRKKRRNHSAHAAMKTTARNPSYSEQVEYLRFLDGHPALVLNADFQPLSHLPLSLWSWQDAVKAVFSGKVTVVETYPDVLIRAVSLNMPLPAVIALNEYIPLAAKQKPAFTRRNVFLRDGYRCQYCSNRFRSYDLSLDHVVPRSHGGKLCWENAVTSCKACNGRKGSLLPPQLGAVGMRLLKQPRMPSSYELSMEAGKMCPRKVHPTWEPFLPN